MDVFDLVAKISVDTSEYEKGLNDASKKSSSVGSKISSGLGKAAKVGAGALTAVAVAGTAMTKALIKGVNATADYGDNVDKMSQKMGLTAKAYQEWDAVMQHCGTSMEGMKASMKTLANAAEKGNKGFEKIGISMSDIQNMSQEELFDATIKGLQGVENTTERTYLAGQLLGRGATELGALLNMTADETQQMKDRVHELGGVMSDEAVKASATFKDNLQDLQTAISGIKRGLSGEFLPAINDLMDGFTKLLTGEAGAEDAIDSGMAKLDTAMDNVMPRIGNLLEKVLPRVIDFGAKLITKVAEQVPKVVVAVAKQIPSVIKTLLQAAQKLLPEIVKMGAQLLKDMASGAKDGVKEFVDVTLELLGTILQTISENLPDILMAGMDLVENLVMGIVEKAPEIVETVFNLIGDFLSSIAERLPEILERGKDMILNLVNGIIQNLPKIVEAVVKGISTFVATVTENLPDILAAGVDIILELAEGLIQAIPDLVARIPEIITALVDGLLSGDMVAKLLDAGLQMIGKIFEGIMNGDFLKLIGDVIVSIGAAVIGAAGALLSVGGKIVGYILDGIKNAWSGLVNWVESGIEAILGDVAKARDEVLAAQAEANAQYAGAIERNRQNHEKYGTAHGASSKQQAQESADHFIKSQREAYQIHSPSKRMHDEVGQYIGQGLALGIQDGYAEVMNNGGEAGKVKSTTSNQMVAGAGGGGDIVIPVYIGNTRLDEIVVTAGQRANYRSGGR